MLRGEGENYLVQRSDGKEVSWHVSIERSTNWSLQWVASDMPSAGDTAPSWKPWAPPLSSSNYSFNVALWAVSNWPEQAHLQGSVILTPLQAHTLSAPRARTWHFAVSRCHSERGFHLPREFLLDRKIIPPRILRQTF